MANKHGLFVKKDPAAHPEFRVAFYCLYSMAIKKPRFPKKRGSSISKETENHILCLGCDLVAKIRKTRAVFIT
jgi:hypothetical protein